MCLIVLVLLPQSAAWLAGAANHGTVPAISSVAVEMLVTAPSCFEARLTTV